MNLRDELIAYEQWSSQGNMFYTLEEIERRVDIYLEASGKNKVTWEDGITFHDNTTEQ